MATKNGLLPKTTTFSQVCLFTTSLLDDGCAPFFWTCVRTRPRWEKRFSDWLRSRNIEHFLPVFEQTRVSHRKKRTTGLPLFPGYVFVPGNYSKISFLDSGCVVRLLKPSCDTEARHLDGQIRNIRQCLASGLPVVPEQTFVPGEEVEVIEGPLMGTVGRYERKGPNGTLFISVDMLGTGVSVELTADCRVESVEHCRRVAC